MSKTTRVLILAVLCAAWETTIPAANAQSCLSYLQDQYLEARRSAQRCGAATELIASIDTTNVPDRGANCSGSINVQSQVTAFNSCTRVYYCASFAYKCAIQRAKAGGNCQTVMAECLSQFPVPK